MLSLSIPCVLSYLIKWALASIDPKSEIELSAQLYLSKFYQSLGFVIHDSMYLEDGIPHLKMVYAP